MKKWIIGTITMIVIAVGAVFGVTKLLNYIEEEEKSLKTQKVMSQQDKKVAEEKPQFSEDEIISTMHRMVHQKVKSSDKWGFIEMTNKEIRSAKNAVESSTNFKYKAKLLSTLERWEKGIFHKRLRIITFCGKFKVVIPERQQNVYRQKKKSSM